MVTENLQIFAELFPIQTAALPKLFACQLVTEGGEPSMVGGKLAYRLRKAFKGHYVWTANRIVTDTPPELTELEKLVERLWGEQPTVFRHLSDIQRDTGWVPGAQVKADFVAQGLLGDVHKDMQKILNRNEEDLETARVERLYEARGWVVEGKPALSLSIFSQLVHKQDLKSYASTTLKPDDLIGLWVAAKTSTLKGEIVGLTGTAAKHRKRLLALTQDEAMQKLINEANDDELVVQVQSGRTEYDYPVSALRIIVRVQDFGRFGINSRKALRVLRIAPKQRAELVKLISEPITARGLVTDPYTSASVPDRFLSIEDVGLSPRLRFGGNSIQPFGERTLLNNLRRHGLYRRAVNFQNDGSIRIGVINALGTTSPSGFLSMLQDELRILGFAASFSPEQKVQGASRANLEKAVNGFQRGKYHILLGFLPDENGEEEEEWSSYHHFKSLTVPQGFASQVVYQSTLGNRYALANVVLGILGKTGNIPFVLAEPLDYADLVVGIDIASRRKTRLPGTINATAISRIYFGNGEFIRYVIRDAPLEGETIPDDVLRSLFPVSEFEGKRVVIHRDGYFRGGEKRVMKEWASEIGATFHFVEILKQGAPRLYARQGSQILQPPKGTAFKLSETEALLVSSLPPFQDATPQPLRIRTEAPFTIERAIHSVLSLTLLHYGSVRAPRLPVTIHYSDRIAYLALKGIKPKELEGSIPFWL